MLSRENEKKEGKEKTRGRLQILMKKKKGIYIPNLNLLQIAKRTEVERSFLGFSPDEA